MRFKKWRNRPGCEVLGVVDIVDKARRLTFSPLSPVPCPLSPPFLARAVRVVRPLVGWGLEAV